MEEKIAYVFGVKLTRWRKLVIAILVIFVLLTVYLVWRFARDVPVDYAGNEDHFKYGSIGSEHEFGIPYWIWKALPELFADKLPGKGYASLGFIYEEGKDLPIGTSKRRVNGFDMVWLNCAVCHTSTVRKSPGSEPLIVTGMPANTLNFQKLIQFFFAAARDRRFTPQRILDQIEAMGGDLDFIDRLILRWAGIYLARERTLAVADRLKLFDRHPDWNPPRADGFVRQPEWGPGRVDTFSGAKAFFAFPFEELPARELIGTTDFPSIWKQEKKKGMQLHWDGNNTSVEERNKSAALGAGVTPPTIDLDRIKRIEDWLLTHKAPAYPYEIDRTLAAKGAPIYKKYCAGCHGVSGDDFSGELVGKVTPIEDITTDRHRLDSYTREVAVNQNTLYAGYPWRFSHFRKTYGYANMPLDGLWLRAPYLHNGSVPNLRALLEPGFKRHDEFYRGNDVYDAANVGFVSDIASQNGQSFFKFDTRLPGNSNVGHEGPRYGTTLPPEQKDAVVEYLKTF